MSNTIQIQFNASATNLNALILALKALNPNVLDAHPSRWVRVDELTGEETDAGPRLDVEIVYGPRPDVQPVIDLVVSYMTALPHVSLR
jgi:hypothetical protein